MDLKATALLKLVYLEMFGHDMSWAAFHVLEVMSSAKYPQKRVGYLSAVQSFRPDTEVLMLATNMLKKDVTSVSVPTIGLPLITLPHIITPSLALSILPDLLPRLGHSNPNVRKKTIVTLYRLALTYPEALRPAWPKIKDMLMDDNEDSGVTAAAINVVCELGWRRPKDFLPLAPRLFDLLVNGGNNWMAIKIIKLFATLTPLEPRLIKKLLPPLTNLIQTTPAMSLLYECISGIIQGGILDGSESYRERDVVAELCVSKLRGMIAVEGDPNLKYVALLAFNKIVASHPELVAQHQDVILACIDDPDISIRNQALQLGSGMITSENLQIVVDRLLRQLREARRPENDETGLAVPRSIEPAADTDSEDPEESLQDTERQTQEAQAIPTEYRAAMIRQVLEMCSRNTYSNILDFEWYVDTLVELVRVLPSQAEGVTMNHDVAAVLGSELRTVAVRVVSVRSYTVQAATNLLLDRETLAAIPGSGLSSLQVLEYAAWIVGEYASSIENPSRALDALLLLPKSTSIAKTICAYLQAAIKVLSVIFTFERHSWTSQTQAKTSLILARTIQFLDRFVDHPSLEVQERAVGFSELIKLAQSAVESHDRDANTSPLLISEVLPSLFNGQELNPVAALAQTKVPLPEDIDLNLPINQSLAQLLLEADNDVLSEAETNPTKTFYYRRPEPVAVVARPAIERIPNVEPSSSYQNDGIYGTEPAAYSLRKTERRERNRDDPFYIPSNNDSGRSTPLHDILRSTNGHELEIESIPIMELDTGDIKPISLGGKTVPAKPRQPVQVLAEETFAGESSDSSHLDQSGAHGDFLPGRKLRKGLLQVDSSNIGNLSLSGEDGGGSDANPMDDTEMAKALANVERLRMEMQRAAERVSVTGDGEAGGTVVKKKKKKKIIAAEGIGETDAQVEGAVVKKKKKKKPKDTPVVVDG